MPSEKQINEMVSIIATLQVSGHISADEAHDYGCRLLNAGDDDDDDDELLKIIRELKPLVNGAQIPFVDDFNPISMPAPYVESDPETAQKIIELESLLPEDYTIRRISPPPPSSTEVRCAELESELEDDYRIYNSAGEEMDYRDNLPLPEIVIKKLPEPTPEDKAAISQVMINNPAQPAGIAIARTTQDNRIIKGMLDPAAISEALAEEHRKIKQGDFSSMEDMLVNQTFILNATFENIITRAGDFGGYSQLKFMPMALRCQTQARQTINTLAEVKGIKVSGSNNRIINNQQHNQQQVENQQVNINSDHNGNNHPQVAPPESTASLMESAGFVSVATGVVIPFVDDSNQGALTHESATPVLQRPAPVQEEQPEPMEVGLSDTAGATGATVPTPDFLR